MAAAEGGGCARTHITSAIKCFLKARALVSLHLARRRRHSFICTREPSKFTPVPQYLVVATR